MKCKCCGAEIPETSVICPFCDTALGQETDLAAGSQATENQMVEQSQQEYAPANSLLGKKYVFQSSRGTNLWGLFNSYITNEVEIGADRLFIKTKPKRFNSAPAVLFEDITGIDFKTKINFFYWIFILASALGALASGGVSILITVLLIIVGRHQEITIHQRNGIEVIMYCGTKAEAEEFKDDISHLATIQ